MTTSGAIRASAAAAAVLATLAALAARAGAAEGPAAPAEAPPKPMAIVVLPFTSEEEGLGPKVAEMIRTKARRLGAVTYDPSSVADALGGEAVSPDAPAERLAGIARERFKADVAVTGHVGGREPYEVRLLAVYPAAGGRPRVLENRYPCANHHVIAIEMARAVREVLGLPPSADPDALDPDAERRWREGPNLVRNPGFEQPNAAKTGPADWQDAEPQMAWTGNPDGRGKVLKFDMDGPTAEGYGLDYYSDWIPLEAGATYRFSCRYKSMGPTLKVFLKGYRPFEASAGYAAQRRETYRRQVHPYGQAGRWNTVTADFVPGATRADQLPEFLKVDLYAYYPAGVVYWDDVVLKKIRDAPVPALADPGQGDGSPLRSDKPPVAPAAEAAGAPPKEKP
jgi:hypothetical protein